MNRARLVLTSSAVVLGGLWALAQPPSPPSTGSPGAPAIGQGAPAGRGQGRGGPRGPRARKTLLIWADTRNGQAQHDSVSHAMAVIERLGYESGAYDTFIRTDSNIIAKQPMRALGLTDGDTTPKPLPSTR